MKVISLQKTCSACPAQWEGKLEDGRMIYIRYRWGHLRLDVSLDPSDDVQDAIGNTVYSMTNPENEFDGYMETTTMKSILSSQLEFDETI